VGSMGVNGWVCMRMRVMSCPHLRASLVAEIGALIRALLALRRRSGHLQTEQNQRHNFRNIADFCMSLSCVTNGEGGRSMGDAELQRSDFSDVGCDGHGGRHGSAGLTSETLPVRAAGSAGVACDA
jgi:hypothetical protein